MGKPDFSKIKRIEFATSVEIERRQEAIDKLLLIIATAVFGCSVGEDAEDWAQHCFVSDLSSVGDFCHDEGDIEKLSAALGFPVTSREFIYEVALRMVAPS